MKSQASTQEDTETIQEFLARAEAFRQENVKHPFVWFTPLATANKPACDQARQSFRPLLGLLKYCLFHLPLIAPCRPRAFDVVFATVFIRDKNGYGDQFFGDLPQQLAKDGIRCALVGKIAWCYDRRSEDLAAEYACVPLFCPSHLLSKYDGLACIVQALAMPFSMKGLSDIQRWRTLGDTAGLASLRDIVVGLFYQKMFSKLWKQNKSMRIVHAFEGNTWESACKAVDPKAIGYQHGAVLPNQTKIFYSHGRPVPHRIISSGPEASKVLVTVCGHGRESIDDGYALRLGRVYQISPKTAYPEKIKRLLYLLQGGEHENIFILNMLLHFHDIGFEVVLRPHPAHPVGQEFDGFQLSTETDLYQDILASDACVYAGSTAAFEAIALGVPVVNIMPSEDPLFRCPAMHYVVQTPEHISEFLDKTEGNDDFVGDFVAARAYFENYFRVPDKQTKDSFKQWLSQSSVS